MATREGMKGRERRAEGEGKGERGRERRRNTKA
jgi:hypothetical protein